MKRWRLPLIVVGVVAVAGVIAWPHLLTAYHLRQARLALGLAHPAEALPHLDAVLARWPASVEAHLLAGRAARQQGDLARADGHIRQAQRLTQGTTDADVAFEWALFQAAVGNLSEVEAYLNRRATKEPHLAPLVWEAQVDGYLRMYRVLDAVGCLDHWLQLDPDSVVARSKRGLAYFQGKSTSRAVEDLRRAIELDPTRDADRRRLALALLDVGGYEEALEHLDRLLARSPEDPEARTAAARCHNVLGRPDRARELLDAVLAKDERYGPALRTRGQVELLGREAAKAEDWLRRAVAVMPEDYQANWLLFQALQQQRKADEAKKQLARAEEIKDRVERLSEIRSRRMSEQPLDPALHTEMGVLLLRSGDRDAAERWLHSALRLDRGHRPAHQALADLYREKGDAVRAEQHRQQAGAK